MNLRLAVFAAAFVLSGVPVCAQDLSSKAPADEYFGHYRLSVLGIANSIRDSGHRIEEGNAGATIDGPLTFVTDAIHAWERAYPRDPWIPRDLFALQVCYLRVHSPRGLQLARKTESWLTADFPEAPEAAEAQIAMADAENGDTFRPTGYAVVRDGGGGDAWERFAALRAPLPPH
ncbi:MAG TPA: hypothetical protein VHT05_09145 [Candidatus Elarobacter sp.]|jgi:hypothetical protein|nr:hypothetical protein [Candidatus Elarobacter sp.]